MNSLMYAPKNDLYYLCAQYGPLVTSGIVLKRTLWDHLLPWSVMNAVWQLPVELTKIACQQWQDNARNLLLGGLTTGTILYTGYQLVRSKQQAEEEQLAMKLQLTEQRARGSNKKRIHGQQQQEQDQEHNSHAPGVDVYHEILAILQEGTFASQKLIDQVVEYNKDGQQLWQEVYEARNRT